MSSSQGPSYTNYSSFEDVQVKRTPRTTNQKKDSTNASGLDPLIAATAELQPPTTIVSAEPTASSTETSNEYYKERITSKGTGAFNQSSKDKRQTSSKRNGRDGDGVATLSTTTTNIQQEQLSQSNDDEYAVTPVIAYTSSPDCIYRGFSTSIHDMYMYPEHERTDCCSITCCGMLQSDRDRFLLTGITPPSPFKRCTVHILLPLTIFVAAGVCAMRIKPLALNEIVSVTLVLSLILYLILQCYKSRSKRLNIRKDLLYTKFQIKLHEESISPRSYGRTVHNLMDHHEHAMTHPEDVEDDPCCHQRTQTASRQDFMLGQTSWDVRCAHPCCLLGCYADDKPRKSRNFNNNYDNEVDITTSTRTNSIFSWVLNVVLNPVCCGMACQCCGVCAVAQEAREVDRVLLPPPYRRIDYVTMEPFLKYYPAIYQRKMRDVGGTIRGENIPAIQNPETNIGNQHKSPRFHFFGTPLSRLSYRLVQALILFLIIMLGWVFAVPYYWRYIIGRKSELQHTFGVSDYLVLLATFGHSIGLMVVVTWLTNAVVHTKEGKPVHSRISLDALIKFFATGFVLSASLAFFWEVVAVLFVDAFVSIALAIAGVDMSSRPIISYNMTETDDDNLYGYGGTANATTANDGSAWWNTARGSSSSSHYHLTHIMGSTLQTSPFLSRFAYTDEVEGHSSRPDYMDVFGLDHPVLYTIYLAVGAFVVASLIEELCKYFGYRMAEEHPDFLTQQELIEASRVIHAKEISSTNDSADEGDDESHESATSVTQKYYASSSLSATTSLEFSNQLKSIQAHGAAITLAMVATAVGFSCCENLIYVFVYAGNSVSLELGVLIERAFFPLHPIAAAIQSIGVCQRDLERARSNHIGYIVFPAVVLHGCFDFFILWIDFIGRIKGEQVEDGDLAITNVTELLSVMSCVLIMLLGLAYYMMRANQQRERLASLDKQNFVDRSNLI